MKIPKTYKLFLLIILSFALLPQAFALANQNIRYKYCFTPGGKCRQKVINIINNAKHEILVQAYSFTSYPIAQALVQAKERGVSVKVILDKTQFGKNRYSKAFYILRNGIPVWKDSKVAIAHNKVIIVDESILETGSYNYTASAEKRNAENVLIIYNNKLAQAYKQNWLKRQWRSLPIKNSYHY